MLCLQPLIKERVTLARDKVTLENKPVLRKEVRHIKQEPYGAMLQRYITALLSLCTLLYTFDASAQLPVHVHYTIKDGLPSNKIYNIRQAPDGYIWIATNKGVSRFDGSRFRNFSVSDGLPTNDVFGTYTDVSGRTWLMDFKQGIHYLKSDSVHTVYDPQKASQEEHILPVSDSKDRTYVSGLENKIFGEHWYVSKDTLRRNAFYHSVSRKYKAEEIVYCDFRRAVILKPDHICVIQDNETREIKISRQVYLGLCKTLEDRNIIQLFYNKLIFRLAPKSLFVLELEHFHTRQVSINALNTSRIIALYRHGSDLQITTNTGLIRLDTSFHVTDSVDLRTFGKEDIAVAIWDHSGNVWIASRDNGIYLLPFFYRNIKRVQPAATGTILRSAYTGTHTYFLTNRNHLLIYSKDRHERTIALPDKIHPGRIPENISLLPDVHNGLYISSIKGAWYLDAQGRLRDMSPLISGNAGPDWASGIKTAFYDVADDRYYISRYVDIFSFSPRYGADSGTAVNRANHIAILDPKTIWLANDNGISQWEKTVTDGRVKLQPTGTVRELQVEHMIADGKGNVITQIGGRGIMVLGPGRLPYLVTEPTIQLIRLTPEGLWIASDKGIRFLTLTAGKYRVQRSYPNINRLLYDEIYDLYPTDHEIVAMTKSGILKIPFDPVNYRDTLFTRKPTIVIHYAGQRLYPANDRLEQNWQKTDIGFSISSFSASYLGAIRYEYFVNDLDHSYHHTAEPFITYPVLPPGTYQFHVRAKAADLDIVSEEAILTLVIHPRWWQSLWLKAGAFLLGSAIIAFFFAWRMKRTRLRLHYQSSLERKAAQMELTALQSQMNPHFIFNALGAVKSHFRFNRVQEAEKMLEDFAQLIRLYLEFSKNQLISLQQDISALQIYTAIEQRRFNHKFSVHFFNRMSAEQESSWQLPPMILQPFVENAINHGLFRKQESGGWLKLFFMHHEERLTVVIDDNGVGRKLATEIGSRLHKLYPSRGNSLVADRIQVLNGLGVAKISYEIIDKYDRQHRPAGTRVIIHFQKKQL